MSEKGKSLHQPVMVKEVLKLLPLEEEREGLFIDATTSTGGHASEIARRLGEKGELIGLDLDLEALQVARERLEEIGANFRLYNINFSRLEELVEVEDLPAPVGLLFDLGLSSRQLDDPERGFSFQREGPLDMRMDREGYRKASEIVNESDKEELTRIIRSYGEERWAPRIAEAIVRKREVDGPLEKTTELAELVEGAIPDRYTYRMKRHPATKTFQAIRIAVNEELSNLEAGLQGGFNVLAPGGVMALLSYHSLEDRRVKGFFREKQADCVCPPDLPVCRCDKRQEMELLTDGALRPSEEEVRRNPRSRSARLRAARKVVGDRE